MKIAFTTDDLVHINAHFGSAKKIAVYEVTPEGYQFLETLEFAGDIKEDGNEDKLLPKITALSDCKIVYVLAIGGSAAARIIRQGVTPVKAKSEEEEITHILEKLVKTLKGNPPPWLRKALQVKSKDFDEIEEKVTV